MTLKLNPKLLDVVEFGDTSKGSTAKHRGTVVETFGDPPRTFLIEIADAEGVPHSYVTQGIEEIRRVRPTDSSSKTPDRSEALVYFEQGILFLQNGLIAQAKDKFSEAFALDQKLRANLLNATNELAERGKLDAAIRVYALILELQSQYGPARRNLSAAYVQRGIQLGRSGLLHEAIENFNSALMLRPSDDAIELIQKNLVAAYTQLGAWHSDIKQYTEAITYFVFAFDLDPSDLTQQNIGIALVAASAARTEPDSPLPDPEFFKQAIQMGLTLSQCLNSYGATLARHNRITEARLALKAAVQADPENQLARSNFETISREEVPENLMLGLIPLEPQELRAAATKILS